MQDKDSNHLWPRWLRWWDKRPLGVLSLTLGQALPLDLRVVGRTLTHSALVGLASGLVGVAFLASLEHLQVWILEGLAGYAPLRAHGETFAVSQAHHTFRPWVLVILPALGGLGCGLITRLAPETRGGGADAMIEAFHLRGGRVRRRVAWVKALASLLTLSTGGAGGREGPTMQIGGALGSLMGRALGVSSRERRILLVSGVAAGLAAVFRTPLGAALLAVEVLYRDGFESEALIPAIFASVVAYSTAISIFGESTLFGRSPHYPFVPSHLPLYALLALLIAGLAILFVRALKGARALAARLPVPDWARAGCGGLVLGAFSAPLIIFVSGRIHLPGQGLGILGGGYGAVQIAISGSEWLKEGWSAVLMLLLLSVAKLVATSLTVGSGGSAGDFAPAMAIGGLFGGALGRAAQLLLHDPRLQPGAFALVGMGAFYGGIAHVPLSALVLVCELAGNYDLLVPLMLTLGVAFVALRKYTLYEAQPLAPSDSPVYRDDIVRRVLERIRVAELVNPTSPPRSFVPLTSTAEMLRTVGETQQEAFPVVDADRRMVGLVTSASLHVLAAEHDDANWTLAADIMQPPVSVEPDDDLRTAVERLVTHALREIPIVGKAGQVIGLLDEAGVARVYLEAANRAEQDGNTDQALSKSVLRRAPERVPIP